MTKSALAATSLVAAVPGGFMAYLAVMAFMNHMAAMPVLLQAVVGATLLCSAMMALSPLGILLFSKGAPKAAKAEKNADSSGIATVPARDSDAALDADELGDLEGDEGFEAAGELGEEDDLGDDAVAAEEDFSGESADETDGDFGELDAEVTTIGSVDDEAFELEDESFEFDDDETK